MDVDGNITDVYNLITELCKQLLAEHSPPEQHLYLPLKDNANIIKRLRSKAFAILLNKSPETYDSYVERRKKDSDPIIELLKHIFTLKVGKRSVSQAKELEGLLNKLVDEKLDTDPGIYATLQLLIGLKSFESEQETSLNVFHHGQTSPLLPEVLWSGNGAPPFQMYPMESFVIPAKFEAMLGVKQKYITRDRTLEFGNKLSFFGQLKPTASTESWRSRNENAISSMVSDGSIGTLELVSSKEYALASFFLPQITENQKNDSHEYKNEIVMEPEPPWVYEVSPRADTASVSEISDVQISNHYFHNYTKTPYNQVDLVWEDVVNAPPVSEHRYWEALGKLDPPKQQRFISETNEAMFHLRRIKQASIMPLLSQEAANSIHLVTEIPCKEFIANVKLLLLGIESSCFVYDDMLGFVMQKNVALTGVSVDSLQTVCYEVLQWGTCFRTLSALITPDPRTGKLQQEGLIFKAMCNSIKEILLHHQAAILRIAVDNGNEMGLIELFKKVRPLGLLIVEVATLCRCSVQNQAALGGGLGILTHIYEEVTKITKPNIALIFYSILKSCCEVYFRFLQKWLFEGICDDEYGEFMIKVRPQYLRHKGHRFWTKGFGINKKSVPGFLDSLAEPILQCGKTVRLLKLCDPKNPLCGILSTSHPAVRVCLSVGQLREQSIHCQEYTRRGQIALGPAVTLSSAFQEQRNVQRQKAELVILAQQDTLMRIKREQEEAVRAIAQSKRELLAKLKHQVEEVAQRKERDKEAELLADKLLADRVNREQEEAEKIQRIEKLNTLNYYNELAAEADKRRIRADCRLRRMQSFEKSIAAKSGAKCEPWESKDEFSAADSNKSDTDQEALDDRGEVNIPENDRKSVIGSVIENVDVGESEQPVNRSAALIDANANTREDENSNLSETPPASESSHHSEKNISIYTDPVPLNVQPDFENNQTHEKDKDKGNTLAKSTRPTVLDVTPISVSSELVIPQQVATLKEALQQNRLKIMGHTVCTNYNFNEEIKNDNNDAQDLFHHDRTIAQTEALINRLRNTDSMVQFSENERGKTDDAYVTSRKTNEAATDALEILKLQIDNMTDAQRNKLKILQQEYGMTPNNNEQNLIVMENRENEIKSNAFEKNGQDELTEGQAVSQDARNYNITDMQRNREKIMGHYDCNAEESPKPFKSVEQESLSDAQRNKIKNMQCSTAPVIEEPDKANVAKLTDAQRNRIKMMEQEFYLCGKPISRKLNGDESAGGTPILTSSSSGAQQFIVDGTTPMSCTTDNFPLSMSSSSSQLHHCIETPLSEIGSEMRSVSTTAEILTADTARSTVTDAGFKFPEKASAFPELFGFGSAAMTPTSESSLTVADVEMIDNTSLQVYLEKSVTIPLFVQSRLVNSAIIKYLLNEQSMLSHLHSLRSYFFLLNGEFAKNLTNLLYSRLYEVSVPIELLNSATLTNILERALISSLNNDHANSEYLSLWASDVPQQMQVSNPGALDCLCLNYKVSWPLNIILDEMLMLQYSKVFKFLLMVGRVTWVLQEDFHILKNEKRAATSEQYHKLQLYRHSMMQFINALHNYLTCSVLHASWAEFEKDLECATTLDQVYLTHVGYIKKILSRCMLSARVEKVRACLYNVFKVILKFHNRVRSQNWIPGPAGYVHPNYEKLEQMYRAFCELRMYLAHVVDKLSTSGYQPYLMHFLNALNINRRYNLRSKNPETEH